MEHAAARLNELIEQPEIELDRILTVIASVDGGDGPDEDHIVAEFDGLAADCKQDPTVADIFGHVYGALGFGGDTVNYYDPANSLIHRAIERRRGLPLTLAAIAAEVGRRRGLDLRLVGMPGHVLLAEGATPSSWFDPFSAGAALDHDDCRQLFARFHAIDAFHDSMLAPMPAYAIAVRVLNNLRIAYAKRGEAAKTIPVLELRADLDSSGPGDRLELANVLAGLGRFDRAAEEYEHLAAIDGDRRDSYLAEARSARAHRN